MGGQLSPDMQAVIVCDRMGWTLDQYLAQPEPFVQALLIKWQEEASKAAQDSKK